MQINIHHLFLAGLLVRNCVDADILDFLIQILGYSCLVVKKKLILQIDIK